MNNDSTLICTRMVVQSQSAIEALKAHNDDLENLKNEYLVISDSTEIQGDTADNMKQHMLDMHDIIEVAIQANETDIKDHELVISVLEGDDYYYSGYYINEQKQIALLNKGEAEQNRDENYQKYLEKEEAGQRTAQLYYGRYKGYKEAAISYKEEYDAWVEKETQFDSYNAGFMNFFAAGKELRQIVFDALTNISTVITNGDYQESVMPENWREKIASILKTRWKYILSTNAFSVEKAEMLYEELNNVDEMTDEEYSAYVKGLEEVLNITIGDDVERDELRQTLEELLADELNKEIVGDSDRFNDQNSTLTQRVFFVELYDDNPANAWDTSQMNYLKEVFEADGYSDWKEDIYNIKFMLYTLEEPYKTLYLENLDDLTIVDLHRAEGGQQSGQNIWLNVEVMDGNKASSYYSLFHELGHIIDYNNGQFTNNYTGGSSGLSFTEILAIEAEIKIDRTIANWLSQETSLSDEEKKKIKNVLLKSIMNTVDVDYYGEPDFNDLFDSAEEAEIAKQCYQDIRNELNNNIPYFAGEAYSGVTGNTIISGYIHSGINDGNSDDRYYWLVEESDSGTTVAYDSEGNVIYDDRVGREVFADLFAGKVIGNSNKNSEEYFDDEAKAFYNQMIEDLSNK